MACVVTPIKNERAKYEVLKILSAEHSNVSSLTLL